MGNEERSVRAFNAIIQMLKAKSEEDHIIYEVNKLWGFAPTWTKKRIKMIKEHDNL